MRINSINIDTSVMRLILSILPQFFFTTYSKKLEFTYEVHASAAPVSFGQKTCAI